MNNFVEKYRQRHSDPKDVYRIKDKQLSFNTRKEFCDYLNTVDNPHNMGTHICYVGSTKYLFEIEPWMFGCLERTKRSRSRIRNICAAQKQ
jgi:hypothetical protein